MQGIGEFGHILTVDGGNECFVNQSDYFVGKAPVRFFQYGNFRCLLRYINVVKNKRLKQTTGFNCLVWHSANRAGKTGHLSASN